jgi:hypothetical protein
MGKQFVSRKTLFPLVCFVLLLTAALGIGAHLYYAEEKEETKHRAY